MPRQTMVNSVMPVFFFLTESQVVWRAASVGSTGSKRTMADTSKPCPQTRVHPPDKQKLQYAKSLMQEDTPLHRDISEVLCALVIKDCCGTSSRNPSCPPDTQYSRSVDVLVLRVGLKPSHLRIRSPSDSNTCVGQSAACTLPKEKQHSSPTQAESAQHTTYGHTMMLTCHRFYTIRPKCRIPKCQYPSRDVW